MIGGEGGGGISQVREGSRAEAMSGGGFMSEILRQWLGGKGWMAIAVFLRWEIGGIVVGVWVDMYGVLIEFGVGEELLGGLWREIPGGKFARMGWGVMLWEDT